MTEIIRIKFRGRGKSYSFAPNGVTARVGDKLVVETAKGMELGLCVEGNTMVEDETVVQPLRPVIRTATTDDLRVEEINTAREKEAFGICQQKIAQHGLEMKLVDVECSFEGNKILFYFTADGRVDFRELVKDLAGVFRTRIELRQIGVRDEAKMIGGIGICGRPFCCHEFTDDFQPVSTKMAKTQSMSLNPVKISGACGRLMCCLRYEQDAYEDLVKHVPKNNAFVQTEDGYGSVTMVNLLRQTVKVRMDGTGDPVFHTYPVDEIAEVPGGRPPEGEPLPDVLKLQPKKKKEEPEEDPWAIPQMLAEEYTAPPAEEKKPAQESGSSRRRSRNRNRGGQRGEKPERTEKPERNERTDRQPHPEKPRMEKPRPQESGKERKNPGRPIQGGPGAPGGGHSTGKRNGQNFHRRGGRPRPRPEGGKDSGAPQGEKKE